MLFYRWWSTCNILTLSLSHKSCGQKTLTIRLQLLSGLTNIVFLSLASEHLARTSPEFSETKTNLFKNREFNAA